MSCFVSAKIFKVATPIKPSTEENIVPQEHVITRGKREREREKKREWRGKRNEERTKGKKEREEKEMEVEGQSGGRKKGRGGRERSVNMIMYYKSVCTCISYRSESEGLRGYKCPSTAALVPLMAAWIKSDWTLNRALSLNTRCCKVLDDSSRVVCSSSFQSRNYTDITWWLCD